MVGLRDVLCLSLLGATATALIPVAWAGGGPTTRARANTPAVRPADTRQYWLGVEVENIAPAFAKQLKLRPDQGLLLKGVFGRSPAARAGLQADDLLIEIDDRPLTSQEDLVAVANGHRTAGPSAGRIGTAGGAPPPVRLTYLREGERHVALLTPEPRPAELRAAGANVQSFVTGDLTDAPDAGAAPALRARNYVLPDGVPARVGPGYLISLNGDGNSSETVRSIQKAVAQGQTVILSQEVDATGAVKNTITVGDQSYVVDAAMTGVPASLKPLASQMLNNAPARQSRPAATASGASRPATIEERVGILEQRLRNEEAQNDQLRQKMSELIDLLRRQQAGSGAARDGTDAAVQGK